MAKAAGISRTKRWRRLFALAMLCVVVAGCRNPHKKPDATKGVVTGVVICADTGKPARFATVILTAIPKKDDKVDGGDLLSAAENTVTDLDGRFRIEAVEPGRYYAYATLEGYLDPVRNIDVAKAMAEPDDRRRALNAIEQWKDHMVEVTVGVHKISDVSLEMERGAEIHGTVNFDDGSPAIGMHFELLRKAGEGWSPVAGEPGAQWSFDEVSDGHGLYGVSNLPAGEYRVCTLMPADAQVSAGRVCLGNTFRAKNAKSVKVAAGESISGVDIEIPLSGLHSVGGTVTVLADGHSPAKGTVRLLYADDRQLVRETAIFDDGSFSFAYVPEDKYILQVTGAQDADKAAPAADTKAAGKETVDATDVPAPGRSYADKELPLMVKDDISDLRVQLGEPAKAANP
jgi:hypothetical protein